ncbi:voltage-gated potassium channel [Pseudovirgaria hyperparasitica]|uniref:Voltage-gated potassium channel n=1 Tax=Pseudovirgaria hyperparasitica TaxID=470096 RepID=A0A6A6WEV7_9PEZI|nr:voltage-gated potassium channel [Pseudovirgaria hyperparasitica]KAF2760520.1 voltage-gated potassium channel [Pseudovirgaria hyperparasitica]
MERPIEDEKPSSSGTDGDGPGGSTNLKDVNEPLDEVSRWKDGEKNYENGQESDWWFASIGVPLLAATLGPLANVLSIGALVTYWRMTVVDGDGNALAELDGIPFPDPRWCYWLNVVSLILGFIGNFFLLMNFTQRIRYIIALPATIILWYIATGILIGILACMNIYVPPDRANGQTYTQGFWYGMAAAAMYLVSSMLLMVNMLGYFLGKYPQKFDLTDHQRTLILQTMLFFIWLAGGGAVFARIETDAGNDGWGFTDAMYFCDVTILTVGFGDLAPASDLGRGLVFPYSVGGIIMLGLVINSIHRFVQELGADKIVKGHFEKTRLRTWDRTVTTSRELQRREGQLSAQIDVRRTISAPFNAVNQSLSRKISSKPRTPMGAVVHDKKSFSIAPTIRRRKPKLLLLREEKDRFDAMRSIQKSTATYKKWWRLCVSIIAFGILWAVGAVVFWQAEQDTQGLTYFQSLYFCYVSLLTIGYGDLSPRSNAGRCFFVVWSLIAVPTMTILISDMGDTIISNFKRGTFKVADFTVLPKAGIWRTFLDNFPTLFNYLQRKAEDRARKKRIKQGMLGPPDEDLEDPETTPNLETLAAEAEHDDTGEADESELAHRLARAIRRTANDLKDDKPKRYSYEEWAEFTRLIRFTTEKNQDAREQDDEGLVDWDWIGEDSPMMAKQSEPEFVLDRLCESLSRYAKRGHVRPAQLSAINLDNVPLEVEESGDRQDGSND